MREEVVSKRPSPNTYVLRLLQASSNTPHTPRAEKVSRRMFYIFVSILLHVVLVSPHSCNIVNTWNDLLLECVRNASLSPIVATRCARSMMSISRLNKI
jgi:hypothetical protein